MPPLREAVEQATGPWVFVIQGGAQAFLALGGHSGLGRVGRRLDRAEDGLERPQRGEAERGADQSVDLQDGLG